MRRLWGWVGVAVWVVGCREPGVGEGIATPSVQSAESAAAAPAIMVHPGESIQAAIDQAGSGGRVEIQPGTYREHLLISTPGLVLAGLGDQAVVLENPGGSNDGIRVTDEADGVVIQNIVVRGFGANGVILLRVDDFVLRRIRAENNGKYGLFPIRSNRGRIEQCTTSGHADTGIYVGQSTDVVIDHNTAFGNVNGIEVENATRVEVVHNETYGNTAGIVVVLLPGLRTKTSSDVLVSQNRVHDNNLANFAEDGFEAAVPAGSGILVIGVDRVTVEKNDVRNNSYVGIAVANTGLVEILTGTPVDVEPFPEGARIGKNILVANGGAQPIPFLPPGTDLLWDGTGSDNCWDKNEAATTLNLDLPGGNPSPDLPACS
jgi:parallel beta-helix repeat protein